MSYVFYIFVYIKAGQPLIYPVYLAPFVVYAVLSAGAFFSARALKEGFFREFGRLSICVAPFLLLFFTPVILRINMPDPHNFLQRKLEIMLGASYAAYLITAASAVAARLYRGGWFAKAKPAAVLKGLFLYFLVFYAAMSLWFNYANEPTGDEPYYLLTAHSIIHDRDLDIKNNLENGDYKAFHSRELKPQGFDVERNGRLHSYHPFFFSAVITPFYLAGGRLGVTLFMNAVAAGLAAMLFYLLLRIYRDRNTAAAVAAVTGFSMPVLGLMNSVAADVTAAFLLLFVYIMIKYHREKAWLISIAAAAVFWVHIRALPVYGCLGLLFLIYNRKSLPRIMVFCGMQLAALAGFVAINYGLYGTPVPVYVEQGKTIADTLGTNIFNGAAAYLFDRQLGLFAYAPVFVLIFAGIFVLFRKRPKLLAELALVALPYYCIISTYYDLGGGSASPRYLVLVMFVIAILLAAAFSGKWDRRPAVLAWAMAIGGFILSAAVCSVPWLRWDRPFGENTILTIIAGFSHLKLSVLFPSFRLPGGNSVALTVSWLAAAAALNVIFLWLKGKKSY